MHLFYAIGIAGTLGLHCLVNIQSIDRVFNADKRDIEEKTCSYLSGEKFSADTSAVDSGKISWIRLIGILEIVVDSSDRPSRLS